MTQIICRLTFLDNVKKFHEPWPHVLTILWRLYIHLQLQIRFGGTHKCNIQIPVRQQRQVRFRTTSVSGQVAHPKVSLPAWSDSQENRVRSCSAATCVSSCAATLTHPFKSKALMRMCCRTSSDVIWGSTAKDRNSTGSAPSHFCKTREKQHVDKVTTSPFQPTYIWHIVVMTMMSTIYYRSIIITMKCDGMKQTGERGAKWRPAAMQQSPFIQ